MRTTQLRVPEESISVLTNGVIEVDCIIVGKPLVDMTSVTWTHSLDLDLSEFVNTVKGNQDDFTLNSTLTIRNPLTTYTGTFNCNVADHDGETISKAVNVFICSEYLKNLHFITIEAWFSVYTSVCSVYYLFITCKKLEVFYNCTSDYISRKYLSSQIQLFSSYIKYFAAFRLYILLLKRLIHHTISNFTDREFLEPPKVSYNNAEFIEKGSQIFITCLVQGIDKLIYILLFINTK